MNGSKNMLKLFACKCPRCREGNMFKNNNPYVLKETMKMNTHCPVCGQPFNIEVGFYYGSSYISYGLTLAISGLSFTAWYFLAGFSVYDDGVFYWLAINALLLLILQPWLMRVSRTGWLALFVPYQKEWKTRELKQYERINIQQENNW